MKEDWQKAFKKAQKKYQESDKRRVIHRVTVKQKEEGVWTLFFHRFAYGEGFCVEFDTGFEDYPETEGNTNYECDDQDLFWRLVCTALDELKE